MSISNENPVGAVITAIRSAKSATDNASARLVNALYTHCEASLNADSILTFFNGENEYRTKVATKFFVDHDTSFVREAAELEKEMDKPADKRNKMGVAEIRQRHGYLRQQFMDAMTALYTLRCGFVEEDGENTKEMVIVSVSMTTNSRFKIVVMDEGERTVYGAPLTTRQLRLMAKESFKQRKVGGKTASAGKTDTKKGGLESLSPANAIRAMATAFTGNVNALKEAQAKADGTDSVSVADLADDVEKTIYDLTEDVLKTVFADNDGRIDMEYMIEWCESRAIKTSIIPKRKTA